MNSALDLDDRFLAARSKTFRFGIQTGAANRTTTVVDAETEADGEGGVKK